MNSPDFSIAVARMFAISDCHAAAIDVVREALDSAPEPSAKAAIWDHAVPILDALGKRSEAAVAAFYKAKKEAGL